MSWGTELWVSLYSLFICLIGRAGLFFKKAMNNMPSGEFLSILKDSAIYDISRVSCYF